MNKPRTFEHFPKQEVCPVCKTSDDGECILIPIDGTSDGSISRAKPFHLYCAIADGYNEVNGIIYKRTYL